MENTKK